MASYRTSCACGARRLLPSRVVAQSWMDEHRVKCPKVDRSEGGKIEITEVAE